MGACICAPLSGQKNVLLIVGLDAAGKTTWLHQLQTGSALATSQPTIVSNYEDFNYKNIPFGMWDLGGQHVYRSLWKYHLAGAKGLLFVLDSTDRLRIREAQRELFELLTEEKLREAFLIVLANKQDKPFSMSAQEVTEALTLNQIGNKRPWFVQPTSALYGEGVTEVMDWVLTNLRRSARPPMPSNSAERRHFPIEHLRCALAWREALDRGQPDEAPLPSSDPATADGGVSGGSDEGSAAPVTLAGSDDMIAVAVASLPIARKPPEDRLPPGPCRAATPTVPPHTPPELASAAAAKTDFPYITAPCVLASSPVLTFRGHPHGGGGEAGGGYGGAAAVQCDLALSSGERADRAEARTAACGVAAAPSHCGSSEWPLGGGGGVCDGGGMESDGGSGGGGAGRPHGASSAAGSAATGAVGAAAVGAAAAAATQAQLVAAVVQGSLNAAVRNPLIGASSLPPFAPRPSTASHGRAGRDRRGVVTGPRGGMDA